jgi:hypothetical protein
MFLWWAIAFSLVVKMKKYWKNNAYYRLLLNNCIKFSNFSAALQKSFAKLEIYIGAGTMDLHISRVYPVNQ